MYTPEDSNWVVNLTLIITMVASSAAILYWAAVTENNIDNNPDK